MVASRGETRGDNRREAMVTSRGETHGDNPQRGDGDIPQRELKHPTADHAALNQSPFAQRSTPQRSGSQVENTLAALLPRHNRPSLSRTGSLAGSTDSPLPDGMDRFSSNPLLQLGMVTQEAGCEEGYTGREVSCHGIPQRGIGSSRHSWNCAANMYLFMYLGA